MDKQLEAFEAWWYDGSYACRPCDRIEIDDEDAFEIWQAAIRSTATVKESLTVESQDKAAP